jgi:hypothetical protein
MTRTEAIAVINAKLAALDDERVVAVAEIIDDIAADTDAVRDLTTRELTLLEQSKVDFAAGRTCSIEEVRTHSDEFIKTLRTRHPTAS